jgi:hypothetical protein
MLRYFLKRQYQKRNRRTRKAMAREKGKQKNQLFKNSENA